MIFGVYNTRVSLLRRWYCIWSDEDDHDDDVAVDDGYDDKYALVTLCVQILL